jgi:putative Ca2+/H+ antiporter (TMEM165/GDT1 family)
MSDSKVLSFTGACEFIAGVLFLLASPLYLVMGTPPSLGNETLFSAYVTRSNTIAITTKLVDVFYLVGFIIFAAGKIVEDWGLDDRLGMLQQLGLVPAMG